MDKRDKNQLLITDGTNAAVRTVDVMSQDVDTFLKSDSFKDLKDITQEEKSGDLYLTARHAVYRIKYVEKTVSLISGYGSGYGGGTLLESLFNWPLELTFIRPETLLVADYNNNKLRLLEMKSDSVTTLNVTNLLSRPTSLLLTNDSLYVGQYKKIFQC